MLNQINGGKKTCYIPYDEWKEDTCITCFDLSSSLGTTPEEILPLVRKGNIRIEAVSKIIGLRRSYPLRHFDRVLPTAPFLESNEFYFTGV